LAVNAELSYGQMRMAWCRWALLAFVRRWATYLVVAVLVLSAGAVGFVDIVMAAAAWLVLPLFYAASQGAWLLSATLLQAAVGGAAVWGMRQLLWPTAWAEAERALPLSPAQTWRSDALVVLLALSPLLLLWALGAASLLAQHPAWLRPVRWRALVALVVASAASVALGVALLQRLRSAPRVATLRPATAARVATAISGRLHWSLAVLCMPLWRGPARRTGLALLWGTGLVLLPAVAIALTPRGVGWWLAALALLALLVTTRVNHLAREELLPLQQACEVLPLAAARIEHARASLGLWPLLLALLALCAALWHVPGLRPAVLMVFVLTTLGSSVAEVLSAPAKADVKAGRWLFSLVLGVCVATEVMV
jgi:hypothetical protein